MSDHRQRWSIKTTVELCLYRTSTVHLQGRVLPFAIRQMIVLFAFGYPLNNDTLRDAVELWCRDRRAALRCYGEINDWDVSQVTSMASLFHLRKGFNDCIDRWDVRRVISMRNMFRGAQAFNQPLAAWSVGGVTHMSSMFQDAVSFNQPLAT